MREKKFYIILIVSLVVLVCSTLFSFWNGRFSGINTVVVLKVLINQVIDVFPRNWTDVAENIIIKVRLPRIISSALVGAALSVSGVTYQALFSNAMASPDTLGVSSGSGVGACLGILFGWSSIMIEFTSFFVGCISVIFVFAMALFISKGKNSEVFLVLTGMVISSFLSAIIAIFKYVADPMDQLPAITYWLMGSFSDVTIENTKMILIVFIIASIPLFLIRWNMNLLVLSTEEARSLGVNINTLRIVAIFSSTLLTAASVSISGIIGWVGLVIPHIARLLVGNDFRKVLLISCVIGAIYLQTMDNIARGWMTNEIPIGILTSIIGAPLFFFILVRNRRKLIDGH